MRKLILPRKMWFVALFLLGALYGAVYGVSWIRNDLVMVYEGPCTPLGLELKESGDVSWIILRFEYQGKQGELKDKKAIFAYLKNPSAPLRIKVDANGAAEYVKPEKRSK